LIAREKRRGHFRRGRILNCPPQRTQAADFISTRLLSDRDNAESRPDRNPRTGSDRRSQL